MAENTGVYKTNKGLFESSQEELSKQTQSPAGAASQGASPDVAKMQATPAQKQSALKSQPQQTLSQSSRYKQKQAPEPAVAQQAQDKVARLKSLGGIESQLEGLIQNKLQQATEQNLQKQALNEQYIQQVTAQEQQAALSEALTNFAQATTPEERQQALIAAKTVDPKITPESINQYFMGTEGALGEQLGAATPESIMLGDVWDEEALGPQAQVAADLGITPEELAGMNMQQLEAKIQEVEAQEFNKIQNLNAELMSATGARREQILRELEGLSQAGQTGAEAQYDRIQRDLEEARTIDIAGEEFALEEILGDDRLSQYILSSLSDENVRQKLMEEAPQLVEWIDANKMALEEMQATTKADVGQFEELQSEIKQTTSANEQLASAIAGDKPEYMTQGQWEDYKEKLENSGAWQAASENKDVAALFKGEDGVALAKELANYDKDTIINLSNLNKQIQTEPVLRAWLGVEDGQFPTDADALKQYDLIKDSMATLKSKNNAAYEALKDYAGQLTPDQLASLAATPDRWDAVKNALDTSKQLESMTFEDTIEKMFGKNFNVDSINEQLTKLKSYADMGHEGALKDYQKLKQLVGEDGYLDDSDLENMKTMMTGASDVDKILKGESGGLSDVTSLSEGMSSVPKFEDDLQNTLFDMIQNNKTTAGDFMDMDLERLEKIGSYDKMVTPKMKQAIDFAKTIKSTGHSSIEKYAKDGKVSYDDALKMLSDSDFIDSDGLDALQSLIGKGILKGNVKTTFGSYPVETAIKSKINAAAKKKSAELAPPGNYPGKRSSFSSAGDEYAHANKAISAADEDIKNIKAALQGPVSGVVKQALKDRLSKAQKLKAEWNSKLGDITTRVTAEQRSTAKKSGSAGEDAFKFLPTPG